MKKTSHFLKQLMTGRDNATFDIVRVGMFIAFCIVCMETVTGIWSVPNTDLDKLGDFIKNFSLSVANILGWGSVGCAAKYHTEPNRVQEAGA